MNLKEQRHAFLSGEMEKASYLKTMYENHHSHLFDYMKYLPETDIRKIEIVDDGVIFTSRKHGIKMLSLEFDYRLAPIEILNFSRYEPEETDMMLNLLPKGAHVFDIGGNAGWYSLLYSRVDPTTKIFSFEPIPKTYELLLKNIELNECKNIQSLNFGLSNLEGDIKFYYYPEGSGNASSAKLSDSPNIEEVSCKVKKLDDCIDELSDSMDFIKCDVEGAELLVFQGGIKSIARHKPIIFSEMLRKWSLKFNYHPNEIISLLVSIGYSCFVVENDSLVEFFKMDDATTQTNYFFLDKNKHKTEIEKYLKI
jgi:FkbM family methyltransferase